LGRSLRAAGDGRGGPVRMLAEISENPRQGGVMGKSLGRSEAEP
jgi:hypothetical protein